MLSEIISTSVRDYTYVRDVDKMCDIVLNRLSYRGIVFPNVTSCTDAAIESEFGTTLRELYSNFAFVNNNILVEAEANLSRNQERCHQICNIVTLFEYDPFDWLVEKIPILKIPACVYGRWSMEDGFNLKYDKYNMMISDCDPLPDFDPTTFNWNWTLPIPSSNGCLTCLYDTEIYLATGMLTGGKQDRMNTLLIPEISIIWRDQMPVILSRVARILTL
jgi:hypothetical protein